MVSMWSNVRLSSCLATINTRLDCVEELCGSEKLYLDLNDVLKQVRRRVRTHTHTHSQTYSNRYTLGVRGAYSKWDVF
jgi:DNA mismatch repair ATPase MutS